MTLAIATSGPGYSVALADGDRIAAWRQGSAERRASAGLLPLVAEVMEAAGVRWDEVDLIAVVDGPGSYTGLRVGLATAKGLAMARGLRVVGVDALEALAFAHGPFAGVGVAGVPAGRGRLYVGRLRWEGERPRLVEAPTVADVATFREHATAGVAGAETALGAPAGSVPGLEARSGRAAQLEPEPRDAGGAASGGPGVDPGAVARLGALLAAAGHAVPPEQLLPRYASEPRLGPAPKIAGRRG